ncbi:hypothetical protein GCM10022198_00340 [Klugiella xanthotipulae]|uniref:HNH endonuclease n=1 Tax=Klugiella xanthotipulae TaxID=244735 RepID=A0A543I5G6_9MICO|nr:hypothetical protein FB466_0640 [Klugiella xanthotipulae]
MAWENSRPSHVPTAVRDACLARDNHRCTVTQRNGTRCPETANLEAAHIDQWVWGETTTVAMVVTKCHWHHNRETQAQAAAARGPRQSYLRAEERHPGLLHE